MTHKILITLVTILAYSLSFAGMVYATTFPASVTVTTPTHPKTISPFIWGAGLTVPGNVTTASTYFQYISKDMITSLGVKLLRFPNGCQSDTYDWKTHRYKYQNNNITVDREVLSIDEALSITQQVGATMLYSINVETKGRTNPCGWTTNYKGTIQDAVAIVQKYRGRITNYELGNESWGFWESDEYMQTALEFARAMKAVDPNIKISIQGFPTTGNNQNPDQPVQSKDVSWTNLIKAHVNDQCSGRPCFDFVTDHPYVYSGYNPLVDNFSPLNFPGMAAYYPLTNYSWMFSQRNADYAPAKLDITEWNLKCWGTMPGTGTALPLTNTSFDNNLTGWTYWSKNPNTGQATISDGSVQLTLSTSSGQSLDANQVSQVVSVQVGQKIEAYTSVLTNSPINVNFIIQQTNPGPHQWAHIGEITAATIQANAWQQIRVHGTAFPDTTQVQIVLRNTKSKEQWTANPTPVITSFDKVRIITPAIASYGMSNPAKNTAEAGMFTLESMLLMSQNEVHTNVYHQLFKGTDCTFFSTDNKLNTQGQAFTLSSVLAEGKMLQTQTESPTSHIYLNADCRSAGCIRGGVDLPYVSAYAGTSKTGTSYIFILNRHTSNSASTTLDLNGLTTGASNMTVKFLTANQYTDKVFIERDQVVRLTSSKKVTINIPSITMVRIQIHTSKPGDFNGDGHVDIYDYNTLVAGFKTIYTIYDYNTLVANFGRK